MKLLNKVIAAIWPSRCIACRKIIKSNTSLCQNCFQKLSYVKQPICKFCSISKERCTCKKHKREYQNCIAPFYFEESAQKILWNLKFNQMPSNALFIAQEIALLMKEEYKETSFDIITAVPLSGSSYRRRGYNQSELLGQELSKILNITFLNHALKKVQENKSQHKLSAQERAGNVFGVYEAERKLVKGKTILLVDDILTTGATVNECSKMLLLAGARAVYCVTGAVTIMNKDYQKS